MTKVRCDKCGDEWLPRKEELPQKCRKCQAGQDHIHWLEPKQAPPMDIPEDLMPLIRELLRLRRGSAAERHIFNVVYYEVLKKVYEPKK